MVKDELNITVGARIRTIRENMGYTRERFSDLCDISDSFLSDVERGNKSLTTKTLYKICSSTNASADYILLGKSETSASQKSKRDQESLDMIAFYLQSLSDSQKNHLMAISREFYLAITGNDADWQQIYTYSTLFEHKTTETRDRPLSKCTCLLFLYDKIFLFEPFFYTLNPQIL